MATSVKMNGVDELVAKLEGLKYDMKRKGGRFALRKAAQVIRKAAQVNVRQYDDTQTGRSIEKNMTERWNGRLFKQTGDLGFRIGVNQGAVLAKKGEEVSTAAGAKTPHWRLLELGTEKMAARPFFRRALSENAQAATNEFISQYQKAIERALKKSGKA